MPISTTIDGEKNLATHVCRGRVTMDDVLESTRGLVAHPDFCDGMKVLWDWSEADMTSHSLQGYREVVVRLKNAGLLRRESKAAYVAPQDYKYGLSRMYQMVEDSHERPLMAFRARDEALHWLNE